MATNTTWWDDSNLWLLSTDPKVLMKQLHIEWMNHEIDSINIDYKTKIVTLSWDAKTLPLDLKFRLGLNVRHFKIIDTNNEVVVNQDIEQNQTINFQLIGQPSLQFREWNVMMSGSPYTWLNKSDILENMEWTETNIPVLKEDGTINDQKIQIQKDSTYWALGKYDVPLYGINKHRLQSTGHVLYQEPSSSDHLTEGKSGYTMSPAYVPEPLEADWWLKNSHVNISQAHAWNFINRPYIVMENWTSMQNDYFQGAVIANSTINHQRYLFYLAHTPIKDNGDFKSIKDHTVSLYMLPIDQDAKVILYVRDSGELIYQRDSKRLLEAAGVFGTKKYEYAAKNTSQKTAMMIGTYLDRHYLQQIADQPGNSTYTLHYIDTPIVYTYEIKKKAWPNINRLYHAPNDILRQCQKEDRYGSFICMNDNKIVTITLPAIKNVWRQWDWYGGYTYVVDHERLSNEGKGGSRLKYGYDAEIKTYIPTLTLLDYPLVYNMSNQESELVTQATDVILNYSRIWAFNNKLDNFSKGHYVGFHNWYPCNPYHFFTPENTRNPQYPASPEAILNPGSWNYQSPEYCSYIYVPGSSDPWPAPEESNVSYANDIWIAWYQCTGTFTSNLPGVIPSFISIFPECDHFYFNEKDELTDRKGDATETHLPNSIGRTKSTLYSLRYEYSGNVSTGGTQQQDFLFHPSIHTNRWVYDDNNETIERFNTRYNIRTSYRQRDKNHNLGWTFTYFLWGYDMERACQAVNTGYALVLFDQKTILTKQSARKLLDLDINLQEAIITINHYFTAEWTRLKLYDTEIILASGAEQKILTNESEPNYKQFKKLFSQYQNTQLVLPKEVFNLDEDVVFDLDLNEWWYNEMPNFVISGAGDSVYRTSSDSAQGKYPFHGENKYVSDDNDVEH